MPTLYARDPNTGTMVPVLGSMTQVQGDTRYLMKAGGTMAGALSVPLVPSGGTSLASKQYTDTRKIAAGVMVWTASATIPSGWLWCSGSLVRRDTYADLFAAIGVRFGVGDGVTTFATPNMQARLMVGLSSGDAAFSPIGALVGAKDVVLPLSGAPNNSGSYTMHNAGASTMLYTSDGAMPAHSGTVDYRTGYENAGNPSVGRASMNLGFGGAAHSNTQPTIILNAIIKT